MQKTSDRRAGETKPPGGAGEGVTRTISPQGLKIHGAHQGVFTLAVT